MRMLKEMRNNNLDILKVILAFLVVALHIFPVTKLKGMEGLVSYEVASGITRIAVPTFFLISGYFLRNKLEDTPYLWKYAKRILLLYIVWQFIYLPDFIRFYHLGRFSSFDVTLKLIYGYWHLWYLLASVLAVGLLYVFRNLSVKIKWSVIILLLFLGYAFQISFQSGFMHDLNAHFLYQSIGTTRNFVFFAFPMMLIGTLYESWKATISKIKFLYFPIWIMLFVEVYFYYQNGVKAMDFLLVLPLLSMLTFTVVMETKPIATLIINPTLSLGIYLCHPYAIRLVYEFLPQKTLGITLVKYVLICALAIVFWWVLDKVNKHFSYFF